MTSIEYGLLVTAVLLLLSIVASKASSRLGVPALLLFLIIGMLAGSDGPGGIHFDDPYLAQSVGVVALILILFSGGLDTDWQRVRPAVWPSLALATIGVGLTTVMVGWFATIVLDFSWLEGLLMGAIVSSTDAAAVFAVLRSRSVNLKGQVQPILELESGSNDPMAVFLTLGLTNLLTHPDASFVELIPEFMVEMVVGAVVGYGMGRGITLLINRARLEAEGLYPVLTLALVLLTYGVTTALAGNGFLAVYLAGLVLGNRDFVHKRSLLRFHDGLAWLMQIAMFLTLGLLVFPSRLVPVMGVALLMAAFLIFLARPISVFLSLLLSRMPLNQKAMIGWVGLRGAVPIILATFPRLAGLPQADMIFNLVFFIVLTSVLIQGTSLPFVARWLGVVAPTPRSSYRYPLEFVPTVGVDSEVVELALPSASPVAGRSITELALPSGALVILIRRGMEQIVPSGSTVLQSDDCLLILADREVLSTVREMLGLEALQPHPTELYTRPTSASSPSDSEPTQTASQQHSM
jgi:cell volume regulation protein A